MRAHREGAIARHWGGALRETDGHGGGAMLRVVLRSYGGENIKGRPAWYSKELAFASFARSARRAQAVLGAQVSVTFVNDGPVAPHLERQMREFCAGTAPTESERRQEPAVAGVGGGAVGTAVADEAVVGLGLRADDTPGAEQSPCGEAPPAQIIDIPGGPVGTQPSYVYALDLPDLLGWSDEDLVLYIEDDYLLAEDALVALAEAAAAIPEAGYFALGHGRPADFSDREQMRAWGIVWWWKPQPNWHVAGRTWVNILGVTSTFAARVGALRADRDIFELCRRPFRRRWLDHETAMLYQGVQPYRGRMYLTGSHGDYEPRLRGVVRALYLLPFRFEVNRRARRQKATGQQRYLYSPSPVEAAHLEDGLIENVPRWEDEARAAIRYARQTGYTLAGHEAGELALTD